MVDTAAPGWGEQALAFNMHVASGKAGKKRGETGKGDRSLIERHQVFIMEMLIRLKGRSR